MEKNARSIGGLFPKIHQCEPKSKLDPHGLKYMRLRAEVDVEGPILQGFRLKLGDELVTIKFKYERLADFCYLCGKIGHNRTHCQAIVNLVNGEPAYGPWMRAEGGGFITVKEGGVVKRVDKEIEEIKDGSDAQEQQEFVNGPANAVVENALGEKERRKTVDGVMEDADESTQRENELTQTPEASVQGPRDLCKDTEDGTCGTEMDQVQFNLNFEFQKEPAPFNSGEGMEMAVGHVEEVLSPKLRKEVGQKRKANQEVELNMGGFKKRTLGHFMHELKQLNIISDAKLRESLRDEERMNKEFGSAKSFKIIENAIAQSRDSKEDSYEDGDKRKGGSSQKWKDKARRQNSGLQTSREADSSGKDGRGETVRTETGVKHDSGESEMVEEAGLIKPPPSP